MRPPPDRCATRSATPHVLLRPQGAVVALVAASVAALAGLLYAGHCEPNNFVGDDGGITLRYATRIAQGKGFSYNDFELVNGASNLLNTYVLAALIRIGSAPGEAVRLLGDVSIALTVGLGVWVFLRRYSIVAASAFLLILLGSVVFFEEAYNGLESPILFVLAIGYFGSLHTRSTLAQAFVLALLIVNKLDGAIAAVAIVVVWARRDHRAILRAAVVTGLLVLPVFLALQLRFGSPVPQSAAVKVLRATSSEFDPAWVLALIWKHVGWLSVLSLAGLVCSPREHRRPVLALGCWALCHVAAFSIIDLGDPYPWYGDAPAFALLVLAAVGVHGLAAGMDRAIARLGERRSKAGPNLGRLLGPALIVLSFLGAVGASGERMLDILIWRSRPPGASVDVPIHGLDNLGRQAAGAWLRGTTSGTEPVLTSYGLTALEYPGPLIDQTGLNSTNSIEVLQTAKYFVIASDVAVPPIVAPLPVVAEFQYATGVRRYKIHATHDSELVRAGVRCWGFSPSQLVSRVGAEIDTGVLHGSRVETLVVVPGTPAWLEVPREITSLSFAAHADPRQREDGPIVMTVRDGEGRELAAVELKPGREEDWTRIELHRMCRVLEITVSGAEGPVGCVGWMATTGAMPDSTWFVLDSPRWKQAMDYVARYGSLARAGAPRSVRSP